MENFRKYLATAALALSTFLSSPNYEVGYQSRISTLVPNNIIKREDYLAGSSKLESTLSGHYKIPSLATEGIPYGDKSKDKNWYDELTGDRSSVQAAVRAAYS